MLHSLLTPQINCCKLIQAKLEPLVFNGFVSIKDWKDHFEMAHVMSLRIHLPLEILG